MTPTHDGQRSDVIQNAISEAMWQLAQRKEGALREIVRERLPRGFKRAADHPRVLRVLYRLRPRWRSTIYYGVDGNVGTTVALDRAGVIHLIDTFHVDKP